MSCPRCGTDTASGAAFCASCGAALGPTPRVPDPLGAGAADAAAFATIDGGTPRPRPRTEQLDTDVTRFGEPGAFATAGVFATAPTPGGSAARQMRMLVAGQTLGTRYHII